MAPRTKILWGMLALIVAGPVVWPYLQFFMLTGSFSSIRHVESLQNPVGVDGWNSDGLLLADGRVLPLPSLSELPDESAALSDVIRRGVEIGDDGRVYGLVKVHHWCGNDPVREHIARVDVAEMLTYLQVGEAAEPVPAPEYLARESGGRFSKWGWNISEFLMFQGWQKMKELDQRHDD